MMESHIFEKLSECLKAGQTAALATLTVADGSSPGKEGFLMLVLSDGTTLGTVGGGRLESLVIERAKECMRLGASEKFRFDLAAGGNAGMTCGGVNEVFIKVFRSRRKLLVAGGGHIGMELYLLCQRLDFQVVIFDDRPEFCSRERFPLALELHHGNIADNLARYPVDDQCFIVIVTHGHRHDEASLRAVVAKPAAYIGMIGSKKKVPLVMEKLRREGIEEKHLARVHAPIGLKLGGDTPAEIAISIMAEILMVLYGGQLAHMKD